MATAISSRTNARVKQLRAAFAGQDRLSAGLLGIEGEHLLEEAIRSGIAVRTIFLTERQAVPEVASRTGAEVVWLTREVFASAVETRSPQGIAALIEPPMFELTDILKRQEVPLVVVAAGLQDPGNLGTIVRSAEAFGASGVITTVGTVSAWNPKTVRASVGSVFRMPVVEATRTELGQLQKTHGIRLLAAVGRAEAGVRSAHDVDLTRPSAFLIGHEGSGLAEEWMKLAEGRITIPCPGPVESLNAAVAAALLLYEASRQRSSSETTVKEEVATPKIPGPLRRRPTVATR
ncbi:TrmH family RNA methyltransferase [Edaphobacter sp. HDX4]|uniref:TrmH family RNA methyltransferase n=1 Tax=Edaphobacter sp. HDX4 TaxID=2794064 RepID=UPI002FE66453